MPERIVILNAQAVHRVLTRIAHEIAERNDTSNHVAIVGVQRGGVHLAHRLGALLQGIWGHPVPVGRLDVNMHRDDLDRHAAPNLHPTVIPFDLQGRTVVLVDDVLFSGRTTRSALDALNDFGRPRRVQCRRHESRHPHHSGPGRSGAVLHSTRRSGACPKNDAQAIYKGIVPGGSASGIVIEGEHDHTEESPPRRPVLR